jgi:hypothetical protein
VLVAAVGDEIGIVSEGARTGTHMSQFRRTSADVPDNLLNRLVLNMMDAAVVKLDPESRRTYLTLAPGHLNGVDPMKREAAAIEKIVAALRPMPQRADWDRIVIVTPTYTSTDLEGLPGKLQGPGVFVQNACQGRMGKRPSDYDSCSTAAQPPSGPEATTPTARSSASTTSSRRSLYAAWVLNANARGIDHRRCSTAQLTIRTCGPDRRSQRILAQFAGVIEASVRRGDTVLRGRSRPGRCASCRHAAALITPAWSSSRRLGPRPTSARAPGVVDVTSGCSIERILADVRHAVDRARQHLHDIALRQTRSDTSARARALAVVDATKVSCAPRLDADDDRPRAVIVRRRPAPVATRAPSRRDVVRFLVQQVDEEALLGRSGNGPAKASVRGEADRGRTRASVSAGAWITATAARRSATNDRSV